MNKPLICELLKKNRTGKIKVLIKNNLYIWSDDDYKYLFKIASAKYVDIFYFMIELNSKKMLFLSDIFDCNTINYSVYDTYYKCMHIVKYMYSNYDTNVYLFNNIDKSLHNIFKQLYFFRVRDCVKNIDTQKTILSDLYLKIIPLQTTHFSVLITDTRTHPNIIEYITKNRILNLMVDETVLVNICNVVSMDVHYIDLYMNNNNYKSKL